MATCTPDYDRDYGPTNRADNNIPFRVAADDPLVVENARLKRALENDIRGHVAAIIWGLVVLAAGATIIYVLRREPSAPEARQNAATQARGFFRDVYGITPGRIYCGNQSDGLCTHNSYINTCTTMGPHGPLYVCCDGARAGSNEGCTATRVTPPTPPPLTPTPPTPPPLR